MIKKLVKLEEFISVEPSLNIPVICITYAPFSYVPHGVVVTEVVFCPSERAVPGPVPPAGDRCAAEDDM